MQKVINIDGKDVKFKTTFTMFYIYKNTFGKDLIQTLIPGLQALAPSASELIEGSGNVTTDTLIDGLGAFNYFEITDLVNILWASAKSANREIPDVEEWVDGFETFPIIDVVKELIPILIPSLFTSKNLKAALAPAAQN